MEGSRPAPASAVDLTRRRDGPGGGEMRGLRVALFSGNYNYTRDGANQALNRLVGDLLTAGAAVRIYSPTSRTPAFAPIGDLVSVPSVPLPGRSEYRLALPRPQRIRRDVEQFAPTVVHLSAPDILGFQAQRMARRLGVPVLASLHTRFETYFAYYGLDWLRPTVERGLRRFYGGCDFVLTPNAAVGELLRRECPNTRIGVWSRGVDRQAFSPARRSHAWRQAVGLADEDVGLLFFGRLVMEKGLDAFVRTVEALGGQPGIRPVIVGDGPAHAWLRKRLPSAVFTGSLTQPELGEVVASSDILLNPSRTETFGIATLEAMAAGLTVVCPAAPSTQDLVISGETGVVVASGQPTDYAQAIAKLSSDAGLRAGIGDAARRQSERYDWRASSQAVMAAYAELGAVPREAAPRQVQL